MKVEAISVSVTVMTEVEVIIGVIVAKLVTVWLSTEVENAVKNWSSVEVDVVNIVSVVLLVIILFTVEYAVTGTWIVVVVVLSNC